MRRKFLFIKITCIVSLIVVIILYFLLYFIPSLKTINRYKRQLKDMNLKIADFARMESAFSFSNEQERQYFVQTEQELTGKFPRVRNREELVTLFTNISNYIQELAQNDGIFNLVLKSGSEEFSVNTSTLSTDKKTLDDLLDFATRRLIRFRKEQQPGTEGSTGRVGKGLSALVKNVKYHIIALSFTGELKNALNFINHIPWSDYYLSEDMILVSAGEIFPYYIVFLKIYYIDLREDT